MEIIDSHAHIYPSKIAEKATAKIGEFYDIKMQMPSGVSDKLLEEKSAGISRFVVHSCATKKEQVRPINEFILAEIKEHSEFIGYMTLHQDLSEDEISSEVSWCIDNGFKGIKLHPDFQKFNIDDKGIYKIYEIVGDRLPILFHTGDDRYDYSSPNRLANVAKLYKSVNFIGAHFGGYRRWNEVDVYRGLDNVYFDTSSSLMFIDKEKAKKLIDKFGVEKFFFGTDFPMWNAKDELERFNSIKLTDSEREKILSENIKTLLKIK